MNNDLNSWPKERLIQAFEELKDQHNMLVKQQQETLESNVALSGAVLEWKNKYAALEKEHEALKAAKTPEPPPVKNYGSQPPIKGRMG